MKQKNKETKTKTNPQTKNNRLVEGKEGRGKAKQVKGGQIYDDG